MEFKNLFKIEKDNRNIIPQVIFSCTFLDWNICTQVKTPITTTISKYKIVNIIFITIDISSLCNIWSHKDYKC